MAFDFATGAVTDDASQKTSAAQTPVTKAPQASGGFDFATGQTTAAPVQQQNQPVAKAPAPLQSQSTSGFDFATGQKGSSPASVTPATPSGGTEGLKLSTTSILDHLIGINPLTYQNIGDTLSTENQKVKANLADANKTISETPAYLNPSAPTVAEAPSKDQEPLPSPDGTDSTKPTLTEQYDIQHPLHRADNIVGSGLVKGYTGGVLSPQVVQPQSTFENVLNDASQAIGGVSAIDTLSKPFQSLETPDAIKAALSKYPSVAKVALPVFDSILKNSPGFITLGQLNPNLKTFGDRLKAAAISTGLSGVQGGFSSLPKIASMPANFAVFYGLSKLDGASNKEAAIQGSIGLLFDAIHPSPGTDVTAQDGILKNKSYETLNEFSKTQVGPDSTPEEIKQAHKEAIIATHPDKGGDQKDAARANAAYDFVKSGSSADQGASATKSEPAATEKEGEPITQFNYATGQHEPVPEPVTEKETPQESVTKETKPLQAETEKSTENIPEKKSVTPLNQKVNQENTEKTVNDILSGNREHKRLDNENQLQQAKDYGVVEEDATPETKVKVYRAGNEGSEISPGDHISLTEAGAKKYLKQREGSTLLTHETEAKNLVKSDGTGNEFVFAPKNPQEGNKIAKAGADINAKIVEKGFEPIPEEEQAKFNSHEGKRAQEVKDVDKLIANEDIETLKDMAIGNKPLPDKIIPDIFFNRMQEWASKQDDPSFLRKLANSPIASIRSETASALESAKHGKEKGSSATEVSKVIKDITESKKAEAEAKANKKGTTLAKQSSKLKSETEKVYKEKSNSRAKKIADDVRQKKYSKLEEFINSIPTC